MSVKEEALKSGVHFSPDEIMADFELALVQSLELEFPGAWVLLPFLPMSVEESPET